MLTDIKKQTTSKLISLKEAAKLLQVEPKVLVELDKRNILEAIRVGPRPFFSQAHSPTGKIIQLTTNHCIFARGHVASVRCYPKEIGMCHPDAIEETCHPRIREEPEPEAMRV